MASEFLIALLVETSSTYGRQILRGIQRFNETANPQRWTAVLEEHDVNAGVPPWIKDWNGHGIISRQRSNDFRDEILAGEIALVELTDRHEEGGVTTVRSDDFQIGRLAAEHFHDRGLANYAFCGFDGESWSDRRKVGFGDSLKSHPSSALFEHQTDWYLQDAKRRVAAMDDLTHWLKQLPKPVGLMACNDVCGKQVLECCYRAAISVPEQIAVLGVDNDDLLCGWCHPPLSSVIPNAELVGFQAAKLLSEMLEHPGDVQKTRELLIPPLGIQPRQSSDLIAVMDTDLSSALRFIRGQATAGITVADVLSHCDASRSTLDRKMRDFLGRTTQQEILRVRLQRVCRLLSQHDIPIESIALQCGYEHPEYLHVVFKREMGMTPGEYRDSLRSF